MTIVSPALCCCSEDPRLMLRTGNVSQAMQSRRIRHADIGMFLKYYRSRRVTVDSQLMVRGI
jgi:hypothetical protein